MLNINILFSAAVLMFVAPSAHSEGLSFDGIVSVSESAFSSDLNSSDRIAFNLVSDVTFSDRFSVGLDIDYGQTSAYNKNINMRRFQLEPTIQFSNGSHVGGYLQSVSFSTSPFGLDLESYGLFAGYDTQKWSIEGYAGSTTLDMQYSSLSSNNIGVTAALRPTDSFEAFCRFDQSGFSEGLGTSGSTFLTAIGAQYEVQKGLLAYGVMQRFNLRGESLKGYAVGGSYDLAAHGIDTPGTVTLEFAKADSGYGSTQSQVTVGWVIALGNAKAHPLNSSLRTARGGVRTPLATGFVNFGVFNVLPPA